jgi:hypothetical protein
MKNGPALAQRVKNLGEADHRLAEEVEKLRVMLDKRLPTEEEWARWPICVDTPKVLFEIR